MFQSTKGTVSMFAVSAVSLLMTGTGCVESTDEADRFREVVPTEQKVALRVPGNGTSTTSQGLRIATEGSAGTTARYYQLTRDLTAVVDFGTAIILGSVWALVNTPPTSVDAKKAVWGPGAGNALEPAIWRFTVTEVGDAEYDYVLEGQLKTGGTWLAVLNGHGFGKSRPEHETGWFKADNDAFKTLEPTRGRDEGTTKVTFDLRQPPKTIAVELRPPAQKGWVDVKVTHDVGGAGSVEITALADMDASKATKLEDIHLLSRWAASGSGRADVVIKNGDLPFVVDATECWSSSFSRVFYADTLNFEPKTGDPSTCAFIQR